MKKKTTKEELNKTKDALSKIDNVADVKYTSKDDIKIIWLVSILRFLR